MFEILAGDDVDTGQVRATNASLDQMDDAYGFWIKLFGSWNSGHSKSPLEEQGIKKPSPRQ